MNASITLDELTLLTDDVSDLAADAAQGYHFEVSADGTEWTNAEATITSVQSQLFDGEAIAQGSYSNMEATLMVRVVAQDSAALATGCAELMRVIRRPGMRQLTYLAPDGASPATVFDVLNVAPAMQFDDLDETRNARTYSLKMLCKPFPRSDTEVRAEGTAVSSPTFGLIDSVSSSSAWSAQDSDWPPASEGQALAFAQSWTPLRYNIMTRPLVSDTAKTSGWSAGSNAISISWASGKMVVTGKPTSATQQVFANAPRAYLIGSGQIRVRFEMGGVFECRFGMVYRWFNASGKQIGGDLTITEVPRTAATHTISALITPVSGATSVAIYPYTEFTNATGGVRTYTVRQVYVGPDGASFFGNTADTSTRTYDWTGTEYASTQVELGLASMVAASGQVSVTAYHRTASGLSPVLTRTASWATTDAAPFLVVTGKLTGAPAALQISGVPGAQTWLKAALISAAADGTFKAYFRTGSQSGTSLNIKVATASGATTATTATLMVTQLDTGTALPAIGTGRQGSFSLDVEGTMPAEASLQVANTGGVGANVIIYTGPANPDFVPALSPSLVAAGTPDATSISNKKFTVPTSSPSAETWKVGHVGLVDSTYAVLAKLSATSLTSGSPYTFNITQHSSADGGTGYYGDTTTTTARILATGTTFSGFAQISTLRLPTVNLDGLSTGLEGLKLWVSGGTWVLDEAWLFDLVNGSFSHILMPSSGYPNVTIQAASPDRPQQHYMVVNDDASVRALDRSVQIWGNHRLDPSTGCDVFAICDAGTPNLSVSASYFPRWDVFAAPLVEDGTD